MVNTPFNVIINFGSYLKNCSPDWLHWAEISVECV